MARYYHLLIPLTLLFTIAGCDSIIFENKSDSILEPSDNVRFLTVSSAFISDSTWTRIPKRGKPNRLFVGGFEGYQSVGLMRFGNLSALLPDSVIDTLSISVNFTALNTIGSPEPTSSILISMYKNRVEWESDSLVTRRIGDFAPLREDLIDTTTVLWRVSDSTAKKFSFDIPLPLLQSWKDSSDTNGVIIISEFSSNFIISSVFPSLQATYHDSDSTTVNISPSSVGYVLSINSGLPLSDPERTYIGGGKAYRGIYRFSSGFLDTLSVTSKISSAELILTIDTSRSILPGRNSSIADLGDFLLFSFLDTTSESSVLFPISISDVDSIRIPTDGNIITLNMTNIIQKWISDNIEDRALLLWSGAEGSQLFRVALYGDDCDLIDDASCVEPVLNVYYVTAGEIE